MTIQIEEGKYYRARDGRRVGPMRRNSCAHSRFMWTAPDWHTFTAEGHLFSSDHKHPFDLVAEWTDELAPAGPPQQEGDRPLNAPKAGIGYDPLTYWKTQQEADRLLVELKCAAQQKNEPIDHDDFTDALAFTFAAQPAVSQILTGIAKPDAGGVTLTLVIDGKARSFRATRATAASLISAVATALAENVG
jgi:hypothetical protein